MATLWKRAAHSVDHLFSLYLTIYPVLVLRAGFGFKLPQSLVFAYLFLHPFEIVCKVRRVASHLAIRK